MEFHDRLVAVVECGKPKRRRRFSLDTGQNLGGTPRYLLGDALLADIREDVGWTIEESLAWRTQFDEPDEIPVAFQSVEAYEHYLVGARDNYRRSTAPQRVIDAL